MTQEEAKKWKNEIAAFAEGKTIQCKDMFCNEWTDIDDPSFKLGCFYRVKPEPTKRLPTIEEVEQWFMENKIFRYKDTGTLERIITFQKTSNEPICDFDRDWHSIHSFCNLYSNLDGSELYITEN